MDTEVYILDTSALVAGFAPEFSDVKQLTVSEVVEEAQSLSVKLKLETAITLGQIKVRDPSKESVDRILDKVEETGDTVSRTDVKILALALDLNERGKKPVIVSDDYAIQNLSRLFNLTYSIIAKPGINSVFKWIKKCPACNRNYPADNDKCKACGSKLFRKPLK